MAETGKKFGSPAVVVFRLAACGFLLAALTGCATGRGTAPVAKPPAVAKTESAKDVIDAVDSVVGAVSGQDVTAADTKRLLKDLRKDEDARAAVKSIAGALSEKKKVKYCPITGKRYNFNMTECPIHHVPLKVLDDE